MEKYRRKKKMQREFKHIYFFFALTDLTQSNTNQSSHILIISISLCLVNINIFIYEYIFLYIYFQLWMQFSRLCIRRLNEAFAPFPPNFPINTVSRHCNFGCFSSSLLLIEIYIFVLNFYYISMMIYINKFILYFYFQNKQINAIPKLMHYFNELFLLLLLLLLLF